MRIPRYVWVFALAIFACVWYRTTSGVFSTPRNLEAFRSLQERARAVSKKALPAVVAVEQLGPFDGELGSKGSRGFASGVIISADGLVLSQHHVSHRYFWDGEGEWQNMEAGELTTVILADGRRAQAELLGADETHDLSLLRILGPGPYPFVPLGPNNGVSIGEWVLELGHPLGYQPRRGAVVRMGRVLRRGKQRFAADCNITGGDSGGPIIDLDGRLVGVPHSVFLEEKLTADWTWDEPSWEKPASMTQAVTIITATNASVIQQRLSDLLDRRLIAFDAKISDALDSFMDPGPMLPHLEWTQGHTTTKPLSQILEPIRQSLVQILDEENKHIATGIVVSADGKILSIIKALPKTPTCRLANGKVVDVSSIAIDEESGLAMLSAESPGLTPLSLINQQETISIGSIVASPIQPEFGSTAVCFGIVSVAPPRSLGRSEESALRFLESDMSVRPRQLGQPLVGLEGNVVGVIVNSTKYGCKALSIDCLAMRVRLADTEASPFVSYATETQPDGGAANLPVHRSGVASLHERTIKLPGPVTGNVSGGSMCPQISMDATGSQWRRQCAGHRSPAGRFRGA